MKSQKQLSIGAFYSAQKLREVSNTAICNTLDYGMERPEQKKSHVK